jgi:hypothetical protein
MIDPTDRTLFGVCRLRIPSQILSQESHYIPSLDGAAIIRELHVFGDQVPVSGVSNPPLAGEVPKAEGFREVPTGEVPTEKPPSATPYSPCQGEDQKHRMLVPPLAGEVAESRRGFSMSTGEVAESRRGFSMSTGEVAESRRGCFVPGFDLDWCTNR